MSDTAIQDNLVTTTSREKYKAKGNPSGISLTELSLKEYLTQAFDDQRKSVDQKWLELAYVLPTKAVYFALRATKKEFSALQSLVTAAAIAKDKRFPASDDSLTIRIPAKMLSHYSCAILLKDTPALENAGSVTHVPTTS
jgi:hypothetical protein